MPAALVILLTLGLCYAFTIAPDITWAHFSADGGDLIAATAAGGVPHPGGYPLYLILARPFQFIPAGTLAFRTNLFSAVCTVSTALVLYAFLSYHLRRGPWAHFISMLAALAYGLAPFVWGQALVTEVYALHGFLMAGCLYVLTVDKFNGNDWVCGFVFGLAAANHLTAVIVFPLILLDFRTGAFVSARSLLTRCAGMASGLLLYLVLPLRAYFHPPVNWGNAATVDGFFWLVSGQIYHNYLFSLTFADVLQRLRAFAGLLLEQYTWIGVLLGIYGMLSLRSHRLLALTLWMGTAFLLYAVFYGSKDSQVNLLPVWLVFAVWLAYGLQDLFELLPDRFRVRLLLAGLLAGLLLMRMTLIFPGVSVAGDSQAQEFIAQSLEEIPGDALVFVNGDAQIFSLWYAQYGLHRRLDITIIASGLLTYPWYTESLGHTYPAMHIPDRDGLQPDDLIEANPNRVVCYISEDKPLLCSQPASRTEPSKECHDLDPVCLPGKPLSLADCRCRL